MERFSKIISDIFLWIMNIGLLIIGVLLSFGLIMEAKEIYCKCQFKYVKKIQNKNVHFIHLPFGKNL